MTKKWGFVLPLWEPLKDKRNGLALKLEKKNNGKEGNLEKIIPKPRRRIGFKIPSNNHT